MAVAVPSFEAEADRRLVAAIAQGSEPALGRLYDRHASLVFGLARRILPNPEDAEEVVQDVFAQVWRDAGRYAPDRGTVAAWMVTLARTRAIDRLRARRARPDVDRAVDPGHAPPLAVSQPSPEQSAVATGDAHAVRRALETLTPTQRSLVELAYFEGLSHTELATRTGAPLGTVKTRLRAAMAALRSVLS